MATKSKSPNKKTKSSAPARSVTTKSAPAKRRVASLQPKRRRIIFSFSAPEAQNVSLVGNFNNWDYTKTMKKDKDGLWTSRVDLEPGKYEYRFLVDGEWRNDPNCQTTQPNSFGTHNCILEISN